MNINDANNPPWDDPVLFVTRRPDGVLPDSLRDHLVGKLAAEVHTQWGVPEVITAPVLLGVATAATCGRYWISKDKHSTFPVALYIAALAEPGTMKSPVLGMATAALKKAQLDTAAHMDPTIHARIRKISALEAAITKVTKDMSAKLAKGQPIDAEEAQAEGLQMDLAQLAGEGEFTQGFRPISWGSDATPEAVVKRAGTQGGRAALLSAEAGLLENIAGRYGEGAVKAEFFNSAYDCEPYEGSRVGDPGRDIPRPWATIVQAIQPHAARIMLDSQVLASRGFLARWLVFIAPSSKYRPRATMPNINRDLLAAWGNSITGIWEPGSEWDVRVDLTVTADAADTLTAFEVEHVAPAMAQAQDEGTSMMMNWLGKIAMTTWRIAAILALTDDPHTVTVTRAHATMAVDIAVLAMAHMDYLVAHGPQASTRSPRYQVLRALIEAHTRGSGGYGGDHSGNENEAEGLTVVNGTFTRRALFQRFKGTTWCEKTDDIEAILQDLTHLGWVHFHGKKTTEKGGRPSEVWELHPQATDHWHTMTGVRP